MIIFLKMLLFFISQKTKILENIIMTWEEELQNCITDSHSIDRQSLHLTPYMNNLIETTHSIALQKQFIPHTPMCDFHFLNDYLQEETYMPIPNLIHRYKSKVIIIATGQCACYCQFCTRQRITRSGEIRFDNFEKILDYIKKHPEINDVLVTGGDPLILSTKKIFSILWEIEKIDNVKVIRVGTRIPITLPKRIDGELIEALRTFNRLYINIHINHPDELTPSSKEAILSLADAGIPLGSQSVFLKGINDNYNILKNLFEQLIQIKVKPYYLYQCDQVRGCEDFIADVRKGIDIINKLCNQVSGFAVPKFVVDTPEMGKMVLAPCSINKVDGDMFYLSNSNGQCSYKTDK